jgi:hypothetical protein
MPEKIKKTACPVRAMPEKIKKPLAPFGQCLKK